MESREGVRLHDAPPAPSEGKGSRRTARAIAPQRHPISSAPPLAPITHHRSLRWCVPCRSWGIGYSADESPRVHQRPARRTACHRAVYCPWLANGIGDGRNPRHGGNAHRQLGAVCPVEADDTPRHATASITRGDAASAPQVTTAVPQDRLQRSCRGWGAYGTYTTYTTHRSYKSYGSYGSYRFRCTVHARCLRQHRFSQES